MMAEQVVGLLLESMSHPVFSEKFGSKGMRQSLTNHRGTSPNSQKQSGRHLSAVHPNFVHHVNTNIRLTSHAIATRFVIWVSHQGLRLLKKNAE